MSHYATVKSGRDVINRKQTSHTNQSKQREQLRVAQFFVCLLLFLVVCIGKGVFPDKTAELRQNLLSFISQDFNIRESLSQLGKSLSGSGTPLEELGNFCMEVFGLQKEQSSIVQTSVPKFSPASSLQTELRFLSGKPAPNKLAAHYMDNEIIKLPHLLPATSEDFSQVSEAEPAKKLEDTVPAVGTIILKSDYNGDKLPDAFTMDHISLGGLKTVTPVKGHLTSEYGYRIHPIKKEKILHEGTDIACPEGTAIGAFADGVVDYVGKSDIFGLYIQLDHGNDIKSFYAHCSKLCAPKGQSVKAGEKIAEVGSTGISTGPHLHLEIKCQGMHLNPAYYVEFENKT